MTNLLPGTPRYQPKQLVEFFGYDHTARALVELELAGIKTLAFLGYIPKEDIALLTPEIKERLLAIPMTSVDKVERDITQHDIRALVRCMKEILPEKLHRWAHTLFTSYDVIDTARTLTFRRAHDHAIRPYTETLILALSKKARALAEIRQIGRTHGQHALPVTAGFWLATILNRVIYNAQQMDMFANNLAGKISGAVGAYNAQAGLGCYSSIAGTFEECVLQELGIKKAAPISTQILPPEPLAFYLFSCTTMSAALAQFGRDCRHLMRTEIAEIIEPFESGQVGSSTMAHKRNPINFENTEGQFLRTKNEFGKVLDTLISEHQRDLVGSCVSRDFPMILVNLAYQMNTLLRPGKTDGRPFIERISVDAEACARNFRMSGDLVLAEPIYIALQWCGFEGDAHEFVNHTLVPAAKSSQTGLMDVLRNDHPEVWELIPSELLELLREPESYVGRAVEKTEEICRMADKYLEASA